MDNEYRSAVEHWITWLFLSEILEELGNWSDRDVNNLDNYQLHWHFIQENLLI